jgi:hypothetical protein
VKLPPGYCAVPPHFDAPDRQWPLSGDTNAPAFQLNIGTEG